MSIAQIVVDIAPEMADLDSDTLARLISYSSSQVSFCFKKLRSLAIAYLTAHTYAMTTRGGAAGALNSIKEGDLAKSFGASTSDNGLSQTGYGLEFLRLRRMMILSVRTRQVTSGC